MIGKTFQKNKLWIYTTVQCFRLYIYRLSLKKRMKREYLLDHLECVLHSVIFAFQAWTRWFGESGAKDFQSPQLSQTTGVEQDPPFWTTWSSADPCERLNITTRTIILTHLRYPWACTRIIGKSIPLIILPHGIEIICAVSQRFLTLSSPQKAQAKLGILTN